MIVSTHQFPKVLGGALVGNLSLFVGFTRTLFAGGLPTFE